MYDDDFDDYLLDDYYDRYQVPVITQRIVSFSHRTRWWERRQLLKMEKERWKVSDYTNTSSSAAIHGNAICSSKCGILPEYSRSENSK